MAPGVASCAPRSGQPPRTMPSPWEPPPGPPPLEGKPPSRSLACSGARIHFRAVLQQNLHRLRVIGPSGPHQRRLSGGFVLRVYGSVMTQKQPPSARALPARAAAISTVSPYLSVVLEFAPPSSSLLDNRGVAVGRGVVDRSQAVAVRGIRVRAGLQQQVHRFGIVVLDRPVESRRAIRKRRIDIGFLLKQCVQSGIVLFSYRRGNTGLIA